MLKSFEDLPGWTFEIRETSFGVYRVDARHTQGWTNSQSGTDPDQLLDACRNAIIEATRKAEGRRKDSANG